MNGLDCFFRVDASIMIGTGHVMRCLSLADTLRKRGGNVSFICRDLPGHLCNYIESQSYAVHRLTRRKDVSNRRNEDYGHAHWLGTTWQVDARETASILSSRNVRSDWLIVDHYALDTRWETELRPCAIKIMVIDDIADRPHACDILLDQNLYEDITIRYKGLVQDDTRQLLGPAYALLRHEFLKTRGCLRDRTGEIRRGLVFLGGSDPADETSKAVRAFEILGRAEIKVDVVVGSTNPHRKQIARLCSELPSFDFHCQINNIAELMAKADLAIGASGSTSFERCCLGLPGIIVSIADNQYLIGKTLQVLGLAVFLGMSKDVDSHDIAESIDYMCRNRNTVLTMSKKCMGIVDGTGADRVADIMTRIMHNKS